MFRNCVDFALDLVGYMPKVCVDIRGSRSARRRIHAGSLEDAALADMQRYIDQSPEAKRQVVAM